MEKPGKTWRKYFGVLVIAAAVSLSAWTRTDAATENEKTVYTFLTDNMGLSPAAACGIMANISAESGFRSGITGLGGAYGICQWAGVRQPRLRSWCAGNGFNYTTLTGQLYFMKYELAAYYPQVNNYIKTVANTSKGAYNAGFYWCYYYERPANTYSSACYRGNLAQNNFWKNMGTDSIYLTGAVAANGVKLSWNKTNGNGYQVKRAAKLNGTYKVIATTGKKAKSYTDGTAKVGKTYYYYIEPLDGENSQIRSNKVSCSMQKSLQDEECRIKLAAAAYTYDGKEKTPKVKVYYDGKKLTKNKDYTVSYNSNTDAGTAYVKVSGKGEYAGTKKLTFEIEKANQKLKVSGVRTVMQEEPVLLKISVKGTPKLKYSTEDTQVAVAKKGKIYPKGAGVTTLTVKAMASDNYKEAVKKVTVTVFPAKPVISRAVSKNRGTALVKWKSAKNLDGYEVQYVRGTSFEDDTKLELIDTQDVRSVTIQGLKAGKNYSFRLRSYVIEGEEILYSQWSDPVILKIIK